MKPNIPLLTKVSTLLLVGVALSGCGVEDEMQKAKIQNDLTEAQRLINLNQMPQARRWIDRAIVADPNDPGIYVTASDKKAMEGQLSIESILTGTGDGSTSAADFKTAELYLAKAAAQFPKDYHVNFSLLQVQRILGETAAAKVTAQNLVNVLEARITAGNVDGDTLTTLSSGYWVLGNRQKAMANTQKAVSIYVSSPEVFNATAYEIAQANSQLDMPQAVNNARLALSKAQAQSADDHYQASIIDTLGWAEYRQGGFETDPVKAQADYKQAEADMKVALESMPREHESRYHLGMIYLAEGDKPAAKSELTKALLIAPDYADAKAAMELVKDAPPMPDIADLPDPGDSGTPQ